MEYKITYANRKSIGIYVRRDGTIEVRCPKYITKKIIEEVLDRKADWINRARERINKRNEGSINDDQKSFFINRANEVIPKKVKYFSELMGVTPKSIRIGNAKSYWGCCSVDNRINFSWRLMMLEDKIIDYVVVHELSHIKEHNHSKKFWNEVERVVPDYKILRNRLKTIK